MSTKTDFKKKRNKTFLICIILALIFTGLAFYFSEGTSPKPDPEFLDPIVVKPQEPKLEEGTELIPEEVVITPTPEPEETIVIDPRGKALYEKSCFACHDFGIAGAPINGKKDTWDKYLPFSIDGMTQNAIEGIRAHPPRGGTNASDDEIRAAVQYMVSTVE